MTKTGFHTGALGLDRAAAAAAVEAGTRRYFAERRARAGPFVDRHFSMRGTMRLHRAAVGWDIARAPLNLMLAGPQLMMRVGSAAAGRLGAAGAARVLRRKLLLDTDVAREIAWLINVELLELPYRQAERVCTRDALAEAILADETVAAPIREALAEIGRRGDDPAFRDRLMGAMAEYTVSRAAAAEITTGLLSLGAGAAALNKLTPGAVTLGPALAAIMAHQAAVGFFPLAPSAGLVASTTGGLMLVSAGFAAFAGVISDPIQRALGLHRARLLRLIAALERQVSDPAAPGFNVHDHYVARLLDLFDIVGAAVRMARL
jgi:hypothetical protein